MSMKQLIRWSGLSLMMAGLLLTLGTIIHPSNETTHSIIAMESRLITGHWLLTFYAAFFLLGLPGVYFSRSNELGRAGLISFLLLFFGTIFYAVSSDYGFNAPVLARLAPETLNAINAYPPIVIMDGLFVLFLTAGFILFGIAVARSGVFTTWSGVLMIIGWPMFMIGSAIALYVFEPIWSIAILGTILLSLGIGDVGYIIWSARPQVELQPAN